LLRRVRLKETQPPPHRGWHKSAGRHSPSIVHESPSPCQQGVVAASRCSTSHVAADKGHWPQQSSSSPLRPLKGSRRFVRRPRCCAQRKSIVGGQPGIVVTKLLLPSTTAQEISSLRSDRQAASLRGEAGSSSSTALQGHK